MTSKILTAAWMILLAPVAAGFGPAVGHVGLPAQDALEWNPQGLEMNRAELERLLAEYEDVAQSSAYSGRLRDRARREAVLVRTRLTEGDFRVGDRVFLDIQGEVAYPDTLPVQPGPRINLPVMGAISLQGVLRSELEDHLTREIGRFIREPVIRAQALIRMSIQGNVGSPGFYTVPSEMLLGEALMMAGGPGQDADLEDLEIRRGQQVIWSGNEIQNAMVEGRTLDQLNLRAGDEVRVPVQATSVWWQTALRYGLPIATSLFLGVRVFGGF